MGALDTILGRDTGPAPQMSYVEPNAAVTPALDLSNMSYEDLSKQLLQRQINALDNPIDPNKSAFLDDPSFKTLIGDKNAMGNIAGLAGTLMQAAALPSMLENARLQNKSLRFNLDTAKQEQARRDNNISAFNSFKG